MTTGDREELVQVVDTVNYQLIEQLGDNNTLMLEYSYGTYAEAIMFMDQVIWNSEDDDREWIEETGSAADDNIVYAHYEPWDGYLRNKVMEVIKQVSKIKL